MIYEVYLSDKLDVESLEKGSGFIAVKPEDYSIDEIKIIKSKGYKVLAYLSVGTIKRSQPWWKDYSEYRLDKFEDSSEEYYVDVRKTVWQKFIARRAMELREEGFSGWWLDNIDIYSKYKSRVMFTALASVFFKCRAVGGYVMINGGAEWIDEAIERGEKVAKYIDGYTQSEIFYRITDDSEGVKFKKQESSLSKLLKKLILSVKEKKVQCFVMEYVDNINARTHVTKWCEKNKVIYCFSSAARSVS